MNLLNRSRYAELPARFFAEVTPTAVAAPRLIRFNHVLAKQLGIQVDGLDTGTLAKLFSGNAVAEGVLPIAMAYAGHQFGHFVPQLGDGRAILLGESLAADGTRRDIQLKGSGRTPYSRGGDGRAALGPVLREYLVSEAMHALGIRTTRALAAVATGEPVYREQALPGAILTRVASSFVRVGTFQFFAARDDAEATRLLADFVIDRHYPAEREQERPYLGLLRAVTDAQATLVADWMCVGFIHGVMNTDNMAVSGETIDFGPCAFLDAYDPAAVFSSIDARGRYAYSNQPAAAAWNLARFAETLLPLIDPDSQRAISLAGEMLATFPANLAQLWLAGLRRKLGLSSSEDGDAQLAEDFLAVMHRGQADFTQTFRTLCDAAENIEGDAAARARFAEPSEYDTWSARWRARLAREPTNSAARAAAMRRANPAFIPRNHRIEEVITAAVERDDFVPFATLSQVLSRPYDTRPEFSAFADPPRPEERVLQTFCGT